MSAAARPDRSRRQARAALACVLLHASLAPVARAAPADAAELKASADAAFDGRRYADALAQYEAALTRGGDPRIRYNVAQTLTALERYAEALASYQQFFAEAPPGTLNAGQQEKFLSLLEDLKSKIARLEIRCAVPGARVLLRDTTVGTTPLPGPTSVNAGPAKLEVLAEGFKPYAAEITLVGGRTAALEVTLERIDFTGRLSVKSSTATAHVLLDGVDRGVTPIELRVDQGSHVVAARADEYIGQERSVTVQPGAQTELTFSLARSPDYHLAYTAFGVGFAGVAVGSVTGVLAFTTLSTARTQCDNATKECGPAGQQDLQASRTYGLLSSVAFGVGAAGIAGGVFGWLSARRGSSAAKPVEVVLMPARLDVVGRF